MALKKAEGALVAEPQTDSPAAKAGVEAGDVITAVDGNPVKDARDLAKKIGAMPPKTSVKLAVLHKGAEKTITLTLGEMPAAKEASAATPSENANVDLSKLGLTLAPASRVAGAGNEGVVVTGSNPPALPPTTAFPPAMSSWKSPANPFRRLPTCAS